MKRGFRFIIALTLSGLVLSACQASPVENGLPEDLSAPTPEPEPLEIVTIWAPEAVSSALSDTVAEFEADFGVEVQFTNLELNEIYQQLESGLNPDIFFGTHSWTQDLVDDAVVSELELGILGNRFPESLENAFRVDDDFYGVAVSEQHVSLICNSELVPEQPSANQLSDIGLGLALDPQLGDPYHLYPFMSSFGVDLENPEETDFGSAAGYEFAAWMAREGSTLFDLTNDFQTIADGFNSGEFGCWLSGPWATAYLEPEILELAVVYPVPDVGDFEATALVDVAGFFINSQSDDPVYANTLVLENFTRNESQLAVASALSGIPAVETDNEFLSGFRETAAETLPTPASEFLNQLWPMLGAAQAELLVEDADSVEIWSSFVSEVEQLRLNTG